jgi:hypothetical protein
VEKSSTLIAASIFIFLGILFFPLIPDNLVSHTGSAAMTSFQASRQMDLDDDIRITTFKIVPNNLIAGENAKLIWEVSGAAQVFIDNNADLVRAEVSTTGQITITPLETTTYILTAYDQEMLGASAVAIVNVHGRPPRPELLVKVDRQHILAGEKTVLRWESHFAAAVSIDNGIGDVGASGSVEIAPPTTTTYTFRAKGLGGSKTIIITVTVTPANPRNIVTPDSISQK